MSLFWLGQLVGLGAVALSLAVYQFNNRVTMLRIAMGSALLFAASFFMLKANTGAALNVLGAIRCYFYFKVTPSKHNSWIFWTFAALSAAAAALTWNGPVSLLALAGTLVYGIAEWQQNTTRIRRLSMLAPPVWFAYNALVRSYPGMAIEVFVMVSNLVGQYRFDKKPKTQAVAD